MSLEQITFKEIQDEIKGLIDLAYMGQYPLFFEAWIVEYGKTLPKRMSWKSAQRNVKTIYKRISHLRTIERKKMAIMAMNDEQRIIFIQSFLKLAEFKVLENYNELH